MKRRILAILLIGFMALVIVGVGMTYVRFQLGARLAEKGLEKTIQSGFGGKLTISRTVIHWLGRFDIEYRGVSVGREGEPEGWLRVSRIVVRPKLRSIFSKSITWKSLDLEDLELRLAGGGGPFPLDYLVSVLPQFGQLRVTGGKVELPQRVIHDLFLSLSNLSTSGPFPLVAKGTLKVDGGSAGRVSIHGLVQRLSEEWNASGLKVSAKIEGRGIDPLWFGGNDSRYFPAELVGSRLSIFAAFDGYPKGWFQTSGTVSILGSPLLEGKDSLDADFAVTWDGQDLEFQKFRLKPPFIPLEIKGRINATREGDPFVSLTVDCPWFSIGKGARILPFVPEKIRSLLESVKEGEISLSSFGFTGPLRSLGPPEDEESLRLWEGVVRLRKIIVPWRGAYFKFRNGAVRMDDGRILAEAVGLRFGGSELEISRLSLSQPFGDRALELTLKGEVDLADIPKWVSTGIIPGKVTRLLSDIEALSGTGDISLRFEKSLGLSISPVLSGRLVLEDGTLRIPHLPGTFKNLEGLVEFSSRELAVDKLRGRWRNSTVIAHGSVSAPFSGHPDLDLSVTGRLDLENLREIGSWKGLPEGMRKVLREVSYPLGQGDYTLTIMGPLDGPEGVKVKGELSVQGGSFRLWNAYPVKGVKGTVLISKGRVMVPHLEGIWKNSDIALKTVLKQSGKTFQRDLTFSGSFDLRDIASERFDHGLPRIWRKFLRPFDFQKGQAFLEVINRKRSDRGTVGGHVTFRNATVRYVPVFPPVTDMDGAVSFDGRGIKTIDVRGRLDSGPVSVQGNLVPNSWDSAPALLIQAGKIDLDELLSWPWKKGFSKGKRTRSPLLVRLEIDRGGYKEIHVTDINGRVRFEEEGISFEEITFASTAGQGLITGWLGFEENGDLSFEFHPYVLRIETSPVLMSFQKAGRKEQLTGLGSAYGVIRGRGNGIKEIARSLNGEIGVFLEEGRIAQFNVLSKVFSLLDFSQVARGNFPNLKEEGMPYRTVTGEIAVNNGRATTDDLLVDGESMKISVVGDLDIPSGDVDLTLGLRRVGAGGKIVRAVPIFGEIVTTDGGSFIHYYLEVKGKIDKPEVKGVPFMSVSDGVSGLMRRLLETPTEVIPFQRQPDLERFFRNRKHPYP
ncbi:MAG: hypothetical protein GTN81_13785 [Proteobacteria bacterium]|nr:hypothetical protein [Pseudomonadota bacterium]